MIRSIITATAAVASATVMIGAAVPAFAADNAPRMTYNAKSQEFCTAPAAITGSNISMPECHTAANWAKLGLTVQLRTTVAQR